MMSQFSIKIFPALLSFCIFVTTTRGKESCNCRCTLPPFEDNENVCEWLKRNSPKVHSNEKQIEHLTRENWEMLSFKRYFEREMNEKVLPFIERVTQQLTAQNSAEILNPSATVPVVDLAAEIEMLKKKFKDERDELETKIEKIEKNCLQITDNLMGKVTAVEIQTVQVENEVLQRINETGEQALKMGKEILVEVTKNEDQNLKIKKEILEKVNETGNEISNLSSDLYSKMKEMETETMELKNEFLLQGYEQKNETANAKLEFLGKITDLEKKTSKLAGEILDKINQIGNQISNLSGNVYSKIGDTEREILQFKDEFFLQGYEQKNQTANVKVELLGKIGDLEKETSKVKGEILQKVNQIGSEISNLNRDMSSKIGDMESEILQFKNDFLLQLYEQKNQTASVKVEFLEKNRDLEKETSKIKNDFLQKATELEKQMSSAKDELLMSMEESVRSRNTELKGEFVKKFKVIEENTSKLRKEMESHVEQVTVLLRGDMESKIEQVNAPLRREISTLRRRWNSFEAKSVEMEKVLEKLDPAEISLNVTNLQYAVSELGSNFANTRFKVSKIQDSSTDIWKNITVIWSRIKPIRTLKTFDGQKTCVNILPSADTLPDKYVAISNSEKDAKDGIFQVLHSIHTVPPNGTRYWHLSCYGVVISSHWLVVSAHCIDKGNVTYEIVDWFQRSPSESYKVKAFLYSENQLCSTCFRSDIGLMQSTIQLNRIRNFTDENTVACLPTSEMRDTVLGKAIFVGYFPTFLTSVFVHKVNILSDDECRKSYPTFDNSMVCTEYEENIVDICDPFHVGLLFKDIGNRTVLIGIVEKCGLPGMPIIYTEVAYFSNWIYTFTDNLENEA